MLACLFSDLVAVFIEIYFQCTTLQYCKVISLQLIKINGKKKINKKKSLSFRAAASDAVPQVLGHPGKAVALAGLSLSLALISVQLSCRYHTQLLDAPVS